MWDEQFIVQGGDVVVIDECHTWYGTGEKILPEHFDFFRKHRHFLHWQSGIACDVVFITQDFADLQRKVVGNNDRAYCMDKHDDLGLPDRYVIHIYKGKSQTKRSHIQEIQDRYNPEIFALYSSHSQKKAGIEVPREIKADSRGNAFHQRIIRYGMPIAFLMIIAAIWTVWRFFHPVSAAVPAVAAVSVTSESKLTYSDKPKSADSDASVSTAYRLLGYFSDSQSMRFLLADSAGRVRTIYQVPNFKLSGNEVELALPDGHVVTRWSGAADKSVPPGAEP